MENTEIREITPEAGQSLQVSVEPLLSAITKKYVTRGLARAVHNDAQAQICREIETGKLDPDSYRLSDLTDAAIEGRYRCGKPCMETADLVRYFRETRQKKIQGVDFDGNTGIEECEVAEATTSVSVCANTREQKPVFLTRARAHVRVLPTKLKSGMAVWFNKNRGECAEHEKRFPLSAMVSIVTVAMSLMLIVASSIMVTGAENKVSRLQKDVDMAAAEVAELRTDFEVQYDLLEIRRIATEEYGMVEEAYLKEHYISMGVGSSDEEFAATRPGTVSLSSILSAIGWK